MDYNNMLLAETVSTVLSNDASSSEITILKVHRGRVFEELLEVFRQDFINLEGVKVEMILPNGEVESSEDLGGVFRDSLSEFWQTFYEKCTEGTNFKIPCIRHDFKADDWKAIARILIKSYLSEKYFPVKFAPVFIKTAMGYEISEKEIMDNFINFISKSEANLVNMCLIDFDAINSEDLIDFVSTYKSKWAPTKENCVQLLKDIAHQELIQKPTYITKCFSEVFKSDLL